MSDCHALTMMARLRLMMGWWLRGGRMSDAAEAGGLHGGRI